MNCPRCTEPMLYAELNKIWQYFSITDDDCIDYECPHPKLEEIVDVVTRHIECYQCGYYEEVQINWDDNEKVIRNETKGDYFK